MAMVNRPLDFKHHDVVRGLRAARAAGIDSPSLRIRTPAGVEYHFGGEVAAPKEGGKAAIPGSQKAPLAERVSSHGMVKRQAADTAPPGRPAKTKRAAAPKEAIGGLARPCKPA